MDKKKRIGELLVEAGIISVKTLERTLEMQKSKPLRLGALLRDMGIVTDEEISEALAMQCNLKTVKDIADMPLTGDVLDLIAADFAMERMVFPIMRYHGMLSVAILDPFDSETMDILRERTGMRIYPLIATRDEIIAAIRRHYNDSLQDSGGKRVLLIDPSPVITRMYRTLLTKEGYRVLSASDSINGLKMAFSTPPDIILFDLMSPRMDSINFIHALRSHQEFASIPVILTSSIPIDMDKYPRDEFGFLFFMKKPATPSHFLTRVKEILLPADNPQTPSAAA